MTRCATASNIDSDKIPQNTPDLKHQETPAKHLRLSKIKMMLFCNQINALMAPLGLSHRATTELSVKLNTVV